MGKRVCLIQPKTRFGSTWESLACGYLGSYLKSKMDVELSFYSGFFDSEGDIMNACKDADIVGFSCTSPQMEQGLKLANKIKNNGNSVITIFGGAHPSALPIQTIAHESVDKVVVGEGEESFYKIVGGFTKASVVVSEQIKDLNSIPFPDRKLIKQERNISIVEKEEGRRVMSIFSSRGCKFNCAFCSSKSVWGRNVRFRSAENILSEMQGLVETWNVEFVKFADDTFTTKPELVKEFSALKRERGIDLPFGCNVRAGLKKETLIDLKKAECKEVWVGVESGSQNILNDMRKGITVNQIRKTFKYAKELDMFIRAYVLIGMPNETIEDIKLTEKLIDEIKPDMVGITILAPYPGTEFYKGFEATDWAEVDEYYNFIWKTKNFTNEDLHRIRRDLIKKYSDKLSFRLSTKPYVQKGKKGKKFCAVCFTDISERKRGAIYCKTCSLNVKKWRDRIHWRKKYG